jgi:F420-dependent oxidoreductase-like protein
MRLGLQVNHFTWPGEPAVIRPTLSAIARAADAAGLASLWVMDHFFQIGGLGQPHEPMLEGYSALSFMAALTERIRLGTMVTGVIYRHPGALVKTVSTLDVLSGGRATLGIGAGWFEREARGLGLPFPPLKTRFEMLEETLQIAHQMWAGNVAPFAGKHFQLAETLNQPMPLSRPRPPILIGGGGETKTLRLVAQYADACNLFARLGPEELTRKLDTLRRHCDTVGRDYAAIEKTALARIQLGADGQGVPELIAQCRALAALGFQQLIFSLATVREVTPLEVIGREVVPVVAEL